MNLVNLSPKSDFFWIGVEHIHMLRRTSVGKNNAVDCRICNGYDHFRSLSITVFSVSENENSLKR